MIATLVTAGAFATSELVRPRLLVDRGGAVVRTTEDGSGSKTLLPGAEARWSPDGTLVVFVRGGDLWTGNADGSGTHRLTRTPDVAEGSPAWTRDGRSIVYDAVAGPDAGGQQIRVVGARGGLSKRIAKGVNEHQPALSPDGGRLAFVSTRDGPPQIFVAAADGSNPVALPELVAADGTHPQDVDNLAWSPDGSTIAATVVFTGAFQIALQPVGGGPPTFLAALPSPYPEDPVWAPDGERLAFDTVDANGGHTVWIAAADGTGAHAIGGGRVTDWRTVPLGRPLFPDLVQRPPSGLVVTAAAHGHWLLGFISLVDNRGPGVLWIRARRPPGSSVMDASQLVQLAGGGVRVQPGAGQLHYTVAPPHYHWHLLHFVRFELRRAGDFKLLVRDRKSGFCLDDDYGIAPGMRHGPPRFVGNCAQFHPEARSTVEGTSVGYTDRYPANFHGQNLDVTRVPAGTYWLVHRVNGDFGLRERRYDNDVASLLVRIAWPGGPHAPPRVTALRACSRERC